MKDDIMSSLFDDVAVEDVESEYDYGDSESKSLKSEKLKKIIKNG